MKIFFYLVFFISCIGLEAKKVKSQKKLIVLSIDGFPGYYLNPDSKFYPYLKNIRKLISKSDYSNRVSTIYPSITYPAHTSMITGVDPIEHGILYNSPLDPLKKYPGSWLWYDEEIKTKTILDFSNEEKLVTASVYWPVTVGAKIKYNIPQYWKNKNDEDEKLLSALSTAGLYNEIRENIKASVLETTGDEEKIHAGLAIWKLKKPDLLLIYTTDLDSIHHEKTVYSNEAKLKLQKIDSLVGELIEETKLYKDKNLSLILVSDHGFREVKSLCYPNRFLVEKNLINPKENSWSYYFKTYGGGGILLDNPNRPFFSDSIDLNELKKEIESKCPNNILNIEDGLKEIQQKFHKDAIAVLESKEGAGISESLTVTDYHRIANPIYYNHGFSPEEVEMKTILISYPKKKIELESVKEVFSLGCNWLKLNCKKGKRR
jgi:predicted AlkP superfamily pyrophosphatase or phosphodiesterase